MQVKIGNTADPQGKINGRWKSMKPDEANKGHSLWMSLLLESTTHSDKDPVGWFRKKIDAREVSRRNHVLVPLVSKWGF